jgi:hypothetical protein
MEKDRFEILLEAIRKKCNLVLEGDDTLWKEIRDSREESNAKHEHTALMVEALRQRIDGVDENLTRRIDEVETHLTGKIDAVAADLSAHRADIESHRPLYQVGEGREKG